MSLGGHILKSTIYTHLYYLYSFSFSIPLNSLMSLQITLEFFFSKIVPNELIYSSKNCNLGNDMNFYPG